MGIFQTTVETRDNHKKEQLRTHYYRNTFKQIVRATEKIVNEEDMIIHNLDENYKELYLIGDGFEIIVSVVEVTPAECAIDFKVNYFSTFGWGRPEKKAIHMFEKYDKNLNLKRKA